MILPIAHIRNPYMEKFGIPRQSGQVPEVVSYIVFEPEYRQKEAFRGLEQYSHIWLIWDFSLARKSTWSATVRPPRLGGNTRMGVFATRSPFRPNPIGLSCVGLKEIRFTEKDGPVLVVEGADLMNGTPILDIKPYLPYTDCRPEAAGGFADHVSKRIRKVEMPRTAAKTLPVEDAEAICRILEQDPRPGYQDDPGRIYGMRYGKWNIRFRVEGDVLTVVDL